MRPRQLADGSAVAQVLMAAVGAGQLLPGRDYTAQALAKDYDASVAAVETALRALASDGLFRLVAGGFRLARVSAGEFRELRELRMLIEVRTLRDAAETGISDTELGRLRVLAQATVHAAESDDSIAYIRADLELHLALVGLRGSVDMVGIVRVLRIRGGLHGIGSEPAAFMRTSAQEHVTLVELLGEGETNAAADLLRRHIGRLDDVMVAGGHGPRDEQAAERADPYEDASG